MLATLVLLLLAITFFEAVSRSGTPREARRPLGSLTVRDHLVAAWAGLVLLTRTHERGRAALANPRAALPSQKLTSHRAPPACRGPEHGVSPCGRSF